MSRESSTRILRLAQEAYTDAAAYIQNMEWLRDVAHSHAGNAEDVESFLQNIEREQAAQSDVTKRTDLKIYLQSILRARNRLGFNRS